MLARKIKKLRKKAKLSQGQLAKKVGITSAHLSRLETGRFQPSVEVLKKLAEYLHVSVDFLLSNTDEEVREIKIEDQSLADRIEMLNSLSAKDREVVIHIIDSLLTKNKIFLSGPGTGLVSNFIRFFDYSRYN